MKPFILVVDDDPNIANLLSDSLEQLGYRVTLCHDAKQALIQAESVKVGLIIMDIMMPVYGSGVDAYRWIRENPHFSKNLPIIFLTGMQEAQARRVVPLNDPKVRLLLKPTTLSKLVSAIRELTSGPAAPGGPVTQTRPRTEPGK